MPTRLGTVRESNSNPETILSGTLSDGSLTGLTVIGVHFAGRQSGNVGSAFQGIYGSLLVNADGSFTYMLDNTDSDTNLLASGEQALERFVLTYMLDGLTQTIAVEIAINGTNEPGQTFTDYTTSIDVTEDIVIGRDEYIRFASSVGYREGYFDGPYADQSWDFTNYGSVTFVSDGSQEQGYAVGPTAPSGRVYNYGRITAAGTADSLGDISAILAFGENFGVASAFHTAPYEAGRVQGRAIGALGVYRNEGLIESVSNVNAIGIWASAGGGLQNSGLIYVEGGADFPEDSNDRPYIVGFRSGGIGDTTNSGTVRVVSHTDLTNSVAFAYFPNGTNVYNTMLFDNSGTIVADQAIVAGNGYQVSMYVTNTGHIEGGLSLDSGVNQIFNAESGFWAGELTVGLNADLFVNAGEIDGSIFLSRSGDQYIGEGTGSVSGSVHGGAGNDALQGSDAVDDLHGDEGSDWLSGGRGADRLTGGSEGDTFFYWSVSDSNFSNRDTITDFTSGSDRIDISMLDPTGFSLTAIGSDTLLRATTASGTLHVLVQGTIAESDVISVRATAELDGTSSSEVLVATVAGSTIRGFDGADMLVGTSASDLLDGGAGSDTMSGGDGDDIYVMDDRGDFIIETASGGYDELRTSISTNMPTYVEVGRLIGTGNIDIGGTRFDNTLIGNSGNNSLFGRGGNNVLIGGLGVDRLYMNIGSHTAVYNSIEESQRGSADIVFYFDPNEDRIDLTALDVEYFTIGEYTRQLDAAGAGAHYFDMTVVSVMTSAGELVIEFNDTPTLDMFQWDRPEGMGARIFGLDEDDVLIGSSDRDTIEGGAGNNTIDGGSNVDTAVYNRFSYRYEITQTSTGVFELSGPDGTDTLTGIEYIRFRDTTIRLLPGTGVSVNFDTADPSVYQSAMNAIRDFDGNALGGDGAWLRIGSADVDGDGDIDQILVNDAIGRFATVGGTDDGLSYFDDYSWAGETRVVGIYIDPLVESGDVVAGSNEDSQRRFQNDLQIENINRVLGADDYDGDGLQEVYFALTDGTAYLHAYMHADGNIRYANYQSQQQVIDFLTSNGYDESTWADWFPTTQEEPGADKAEEVTTLRQPEFVDVLYGSSSDGAPFMAQQFEMGLYPPVENLA